MNSDEAFYHFYQYGPTGSVDREFVDIVREKKRKRGEEWWWESEIIILLMKYKHTSHALKGGYCTSRPLGSIYKQHEWTNAKMCQLINNMNGQMQKCVSHRSENDISCPGAESCTTPQPQANSPPSKKLQLYRRGQVNFKNVILDEHGKRKKKCFLRSMGSTFLSFATPPQWNDYFFFDIISAEGCQKWQNMIPTLHEKHKKKCFLRSMGSRFSIFATPLEWY